MSAFLRVPEVALSSMSVFELKKLLLTKLQEVLASKLAEGIAASFIEALKEKLCSQDVGEKMRVERNGYALMPASSGRVVLLQESYRELIAEVRASYSQGLKTHESRAISMCGTPPGRLGDNLSVWLPTGYVELDRNAAKHLADVLMVFSLTGQLPDAPRPA